MYLYSIFRYLVFIYYFSLWIFIQKVSASNKIGNTVGKIFGPFIKYSV